MSRTAVLHLQNGQERTVANLIRNLSRETVSSEVTVEVKNVSKMEAHSTVHDTTATRPELEALNRITSIQS